MKFFRNIFIYSSVALGSLAPVQADVLKIKSVASSPSQALNSKAYPHRGMTMQQVENRFGPPRNRIAAIGEPPISRWIYEGYTVYFEHQYVIQAVLELP